MTRVEQTVLHRVYPVEQHGDTVVLRPRGDAVGFTFANVSAEMAKVRELVKNGSLRHLLVDLSDDRYFGSMVIGDIVELGQLVRSRGGRTGFCEVSGDMAKVLQLMKLDDQWEFFSTQADGLRALATVPWRERLMDYKPVLAWVAGLCVAFAVFWFFPRTNYCRLYHEKMAALWQESLQQQPQAGVDEWERILKRNETRLEPIVAHLDRRTQNGQITHGEMCLLYAARDYWMKGLARHGPDADYSRTMVQFYLDVAQAEFNRQPYPKEPVPPALQQSNLVDSNPVETDPTPSQPSPADASAAPVSNGDPQVVPVSGNGPDGARVELP